MEVQQELYLVGLMPGERVVILWGKKGGGITEYLKISLMICSFIACSKKYFHFFHSMKTNEIYLIHDCMFVFCLL